MRVNSWKKEIFQTLISIENKKNKVTWLFDCFCVRGDVCETLKLAIRKYHEAIKSRAFIEDNEIREGIFNMIELLESNSRKTYNQIIQAKIKLEP
jgi:excinuclease UvrABC helicase subunit UvrB